MKILYYKTATNSPIRQFDNSVSIISTILTNKQAVVGNSNPVKYDTEVLLRNTDTKTKVSLIKYPPNTYETRVNLTPSLTISFNDIWVKIGQPDFSDDIKVMVLDTESDIIYEVNNTSSAFSTYMKLYELVIVNAAQQITDDERELSVRVIDTIKRFI